MTLARTDGSLSVGWDACGSASLVSSSEDVEATLLTPLSEWHLDASLPHGDRSKEYSMVWLAEAACFPIGDWRSGSNV